MGTVDTDKRVHSVVSVLVCTVCSSVFARMLRVNMIDLYTLFPLPLHCGEFIDLFPHSSLHMCQFLVKMV